MNEEKEILIPLEYEQLGGFFGQLAFAEKDNKYGYIDSVNRILIGFQFDKASNFEIYNRTDLDMLWWKRTIKLDI